MCVQVTYKQAISCWLKLQILTCILMYTCFHFANQNIYQWMLFQSVCTSCRKCYWCILRYIISIYSVSQLLKNKWLYQEINMICTKYTWGPEHVCIHLNYYVNCSLWKTVAKPHQNDQIRKKDVHIHIVFQVLLLHFQHFLSQPWVSLCSPPKNRQLHPAPFSGPWACRLLQVPYLKRSNSLVHRTDRSSFWKNVSA